VAWTKNERPVGLKTRKGDPGKKLGAYKKKKIHSWWIENQKGRSRKKLGIQKKNGEAKEKPDKWSVATRKNFGSVHEWRLQPDFCLMGFILKECLLRYQLLLHTRLYRDSDLISLQWYYLRGRLLSVCIATSVRLPPQPSSLVSSSYLQWYSYTIIQINIHSHIHAYIHSCIYTFTHSCIHTFMHIYIHALTYIQKIIYTQLHRLPWFLIQQNSQKMLSRVWIHFKCRVPQTVGSQIHISFSPIIFSSFTPSTLPLPLSCVLLSYNDNKHQHCLLFYLVSCSPTMTADTNIALSFILCFALH